MPDEAIENEKPVLVTPSYWRDAQLPLQSLIFLLPLLALYELGTLVYATDKVTGVRRFIYARSLLADLFEYFGVQAYYLPGLIVVVGLMGWHLTRRDRWFIRPTLYVGMLVESVLWGGCLFVLVLAVVRQPLGQFALMAGGAHNAPWQQMLVFSVGAGIYEELLFRLLGIMVLHVIFVDLLPLKDHWGAALAVVGSAVAFALYHFSDQNPFDWNKCLLYTGAGLYFAFVYVLRGFGVVVATHAMYDIIVVVTQLMSSGRDS